MSFMCIKPVFILFLALLILSSIFVFAPSIYCQNKTDFSDIPDEHWAVEPVNELVKEGLVQGWDGKFMGDKSFTRYEMAEILAPLVREFKHIAKIIKEHKLKNAMSLLVHDKKDALTVNQRVSTVSAPSDDLEFEQFKEQVQINTVALNHLSDDLDVAGLKKQVQANKDALNRPSDNGDVEQLKEQVQSNSDILDGMMTNGLMASGLSRKESTSLLDGDTKALDKLHKLYDNLQDQLQENTKRLTTIAVKGSINKVKLDELSELNRICEDLAGRIENNSKVLTNVMVKSSVNTATINDLIH